MTTVQPANPRRIDGHSSGEGLGGSSASSPFQTLAVLNALGPVRSAIISNADHEHLAAWRFALPVEFILVSETAQAYKPDPRVFQRALRQLGVAPQDVLHVGDSEVDDVTGAKAAGLLGHVGWAAARRSVVNGRRATGR